VKTHKVAKAPKDPKKKFLSYAKFGFERVILTWKIAA